MSSREYDAATLAAQTAVSRKLTRNNPRLPSGAANHMARYRGHPGFTVVGGSSHPDRNGLVVITNYYAPALVVCEIKVDGNYHNYLSLVERIDWLESAEKRFRLFPDVLEDSDAKRAQDVAWVSNDRMIYTQNTSRNEVYVIQKIDGQWVFISSIALTGTDDGFIESIVVVGEHLYVYKSRRDGTHTNWLECYNMSTFERVPHSVEHPKDYWFYMGEPIDGVPTFISSVEHSGSMPQGLYKGNGLRVPNANGKTVLFPWGSEPDDAKAHKGDALVVADRQALGEFGAPTDIIHVPAKLIHT